MYLFAGLGNIGKEYENTRHNLGFICVDKIIEKYGYKDKKDKFNATIFSTVIDEKIVLIVKPNTYMNRSGIAISQIKSFYKIPLENIFVFHDDLDLSLGKIKFKIGGSSAGHNGLKSIDQFIGNNYARIRLDIGRPNNKNDIVDFVLNKFNSEEKIILNNIIDVVSRSVVYLFSDKKDCFINMCNKYINIKY